MAATAKLHFQPESYQLADGTRATLRAVRPDDAPRIQAFVSRLSPESIYYRFLSPVTSLSDADAARLANVDYEDRMALVATVWGDESELIIAVGRYARSETQPDRAECAIVVEDRYQGQGLARFLLKHLARYASQHGVRVFTGTIDGGNQRMKNLLQKSGLPMRLVAGSRGEQEVEVDVRPPE